MITIHPVVVEIFLDEQHAFFFLSWFCFDSLCLAVHTCAHIHTFTHHPSHTFMGISKTCRTRQIIFFTSSSIISLSSTEHLKEHFNISVSLYLSLSLLLFAFRKKETQSVMAAHFTLRRWIQTANRTRRQKLMKTNCTSLNLIIVCFEGLICKILLFYVFLRLTRLYPKGPLKPAFIKIV